MGLIEDAKAAADAKMSYGEYKSRQGFVAVKRTGKKVCAKCGNPLMPHQYKYCSAKCREAIKVDDAAAIKAAQEELQKNTQNIVAQLYQQAQAQQQAEQGPIDGTPNE